MARVISQCHTLPLSCMCSMLMAAHCTAVLRHDAVGQETLLNLLLRNYLHYNLYDQVCGSGPVKRTDTKLH